MVSSWPISDYVASSAGKVDHVMSCDPYDFLDVVAMVKSSQSDEMTFSVFVSLMDRNMVIPLIVCVLDGS